MTLRLFGSYYDEKVASLSLIGEEKLRCIHAVMKRVVHLPGGMAEVGVYRGGTLRFLANVCLDLGKECIGFDTFAGIPVWDECDFHRPGDFDDELATRDAVSKMLEDISCVNLVKGVFPNSAWNITDEFCLVHLDGDQYQTTKDALEFFWPKMVDGGAIVLDDYQFANCPGVEMALKEFGQQIHPRSHQAIIYK